MSQDTSPIVLLGGFLSQASLYKGFSQRLMSFTGQKVFVVNTRFFDWPPTISKLGWLLILNKLDRTVKNACKACAGEKITLIGHSQGGILGRLYLSSHSILGKSFGGREYVAHLIMLGSPQLNQGGIQRGGHMARWVQKHVPDAKFSPQVRYTSVAGKCVYGQRSGSPSARFAHKVYKDIGGKGDVWGDGLVPVSAALLPGSEQITLDGVSHHAIFGRPWYGSEGVIQIWWR